MGLRPAGESVRLNELKGKLIALRYLGEDVNVDTEYGMQTAARAEVVVFDQTDDGVTARKLGQGLVFQRAIQNEIRGSTDWSVGVFEQIARPTDGAPDATMYQLGGFEEDIEVLAAAMETAGITI